MRLVRTLKQTARNAIDSFYCENIPGKQNIGSPHADNWFILTDNLNEKSIIYSGGVGKDISFELQLARYGCKILLFDPSPTGMATIRSTQLPPNMSFFNKGLAGKNAIVSFSEPVNPKEGSYRLGESGSATVEFECRTLSSLFKENNHTRIELLKIDIEGFEYEVLDDVLSSSADIRQIVVEFHDFYENIEKAKTSRCIDKLKGTGYKLFHKRGHDYSFVKTSQPGV